MVLRASTLSCRCSSASLPDLRSDAQTIHNTNVSRHKWTRPAYRVASVFPAQTLKFLVGYGHQAKFM